MKISILKLLSSCIDANSQGCQVIRDFYFSNNNNNNNADGQQQQGSTAVGKVSFRSCFLID